MSTFRHILLIIILFLTPSKTEDIPGNLTDLAICKLTHLGLEYLGNVSKTDSLARCQSWSSDKPHKIPSTITDTLFPDGSRKKAKNHCRNPTKDAQGPFCYTLNNDLLYETCNLPLCSFSQCRLTGVGSEYAGNHQKTFTDKECLKWNKDRKKVHYKGEITPIKKYDKINFPEQNLKKAKNYCRNPNADIAGPWCFIENENDEIEIEYCDIPFCEEFDCVVFTTNHTTYAHYIEMNETSTNFTFGIKLWDSDAFLEASARLTLTLIAAPFTANEIRDLGVGIEVLVTNKKCCLQAGYKSDLECEDTWGLLKSTKFTMFSLTWGGPFISLGLEGKNKPIIIAEITTKNTLMGFKKDKFKYYSAVGANIFWSFPFCVDEYFCDVHTTSGKLLQQFWPLRRTEIGCDLSFHIRALSSAYINLIPSPTIINPNIVIQLQDSNGFTRIIHTNDNGVVTIIKEIELPNILDYWEWHEFSLSIFANTLQLYWTRSMGSFIVFEIKDDFFAKCRWFSVTSKTIAHWTLFCKPPSYAQPPKAFLPECAINEKEINYKGTQHVTSDGQMCLPWATPTIPEEVKEHFLNNMTKMFKAWNYCRDPSRDEKGTYCYIFNSEGSLDKVYCRLRKCKSQECRLAGTGNDYIGTLNQTRSNKTCDYWSANKTVHKIDTKLLNTSLFADLNVEQALNYCRNPSRDMAGSWCYTTDPKIAKDVCNVRDCDRPEENVIITTKSETRSYYILPEWKITGFNFGVKQWNPDLVEALVFEIVPFNLTPSASLILGDKGNEEITFYYRDKLLKNKAFAHLLSSGKWIDFWLVMKNNEISLGYKDLPTAIFSVNHEFGFEPVFINMRVKQHHPLGVFVKDCLTENITTKQWGSYFPLGFSRKIQQNDYKNLSLSLRAVGVVHIALFYLMQEPNYVIKIDDLYKEIQFVFNNKILKREKIANPPILTADSWTRLHFNFESNCLTITKDDETIFHHCLNGDLLIYWFSVGAEHGWVSWSSNDCPPVEIDGPPRDGGWSKWSPWQCSVTCGGGEGFRTRTCTNPTPNIYGKLCPGSQKSIGVCNNFQCGELSDESLEKIRRKLQTEKSNLIAKEGKPVVLKNDPEIMAVIKKESPDAYYEWSLNGIYINAKERVKFQKDDLVINNALPEDSGVYVCMLFRINKKRLVLKVISLAVTTANPIKIRATLPFMLDCKAVVLSYIYSELRLKLLINDQVYKDFGIVMLAVVNYHNFILNKSHSGEWKCLIQQRDLGLLWTTNTVRLKVLKAPNFYTHLMEDQLTKPLFGWLRTETNCLVAIILLISLACGIGGLILFIYFKFCRLRNRFNL